MNVLFTGFEPFGKLDYNPSWDAAAAAAEAFGGVAELLEVTWDAARDAVRQSSEFDLAVHFGVAAERQAPCLERYAHNTRSDLLRAAQLVDDGPHAIECSLPLNALVEVLSNATGDAWYVSDDAGTYVCNATLYHALWQLGADRAMFVHVPMLSPEDARSLGRAVANALKSPEFLHS